MGGVWDLACVESVSEDECKICVAELECRSLIKTFNKLQVLECEEDDECPELTYESDEEEGVMKQKILAPQPGQNEKTELVPQPGLNEKRRKRQWQKFQDCESQHVGAPQGNAYKGSYRDRTYHGQSEMNYPGPVNLCVAEEKKVSLGLFFQVCNVKKALIAVKRICEKGNQVLSGPKMKTTIFRI